MSLRALKLALSISIVIAGVMAGATSSQAQNKGGQIITVAIADVAAYVRPGSAMDREAERRGNSVYFPDRVVPMLPERLSNDLCSLVPGADRPCLAARRWIEEAPAKTIGSPAGTVPQRWTTRTWLTSNRCAQATAISSIDWRVRVG